jgi:general transcription factor 3C polypeptide 3 (transcription factor C subunit 4)
MLIGDGEAEKNWLNEAEKLVETFRETRNLFLTSRVRLLISFHVKPPEIVFYQTHPFRGMFPRKRTKHQMEIEADEDRMASRLQLDLGEVVAK